MAFSDSQQTSVSCGPSGVNVYIYSSVALQLELFYQKEKPSLRLFLNLSASFLAWKERLKTEVSFLQLGKLIRKSLIILGFLHSCPLPEYILCSTHIIKLRLP